MGRFLFQGHRIGLAMMIIAVAACSPAGSGTTTPPGTTASPGNAPPAVRGAESETEPEAEGSRVAEWTAALPAPPPPEPALLEREPEAIAAWFRDLEQWTASLLMAARRSGGGGARERVVLHPTTPPPALWENVTLAYELEWPAGGGEGFRVARVRHLEVP